MSALRPKPVFMTPKDGHRFVEELAKHQTDLNVWAAEAMQDAADRIEKALDKLQPPDAEATFAAALFCIRCGRDALHTITYGRVGGEVASCQSCGHLSPVARGIADDLHP